MNWIDSVMILVTEKRQGAHDMAVKSVCINTGDKEGRAPWVLAGFVGCIIPVLVLLYYYLFSF
jgi:hypothetical protein